MAPGGGQPDGDVRQVAGVVGHGVQPGRGAGQQALQHGIVRFIIPRKKYHILWTSVGESYCSYCIATIKHKIQFLFSAQF